MRNSVCELVNEPCAITRNERSLELADCDPKHSLEGCAPILKQVQDRGCALFGPDLFSRNHGCAD